MSKKALGALILAFMLVISAMPAYAEINLDVDAQNTAAGQITSGEKLYKYGFITGNENGLDEGSSLTRAEMAVILSDFYGVKEEAAHFDMPANFTDVRDSWAKNYIAYGQAQGWFGGYPDHSYKPDAPVTSQDLAVFVLNVLGYNGDYTYKEAETFAKDLDLVLDESDNMLRGNAFDTIWSALHLHAKGETEALGVKLGKLPPDTLATGAFGVEKAELIGLGFLSFDFNQELEASYGLNRDYLSIYVNDKKLDRNHFSTYFFGEYPKIQFGEGVIHQNDKITVKIDSLYNADQTESIKGWEKTFTANDQSLPELVDAEVIGQNRIRVTVNENMASNANLKNYFSINKDQVYVKEARQWVDTNVFIPKFYYDITTYGTFKDGETVDLEVKAGLKDLAGYPLMAQSKSLVVKAQTEKPVIEGYICNDSKDVQVIWSQYVEGNQTDYSEYIYHTNQSNKVDSVTNNLAGYLDLDFRSTLLPEGKAYIYINKGAVVDLWGNENDDTLLEVDVPVQKTLEATAVTFKDSQTLDISFNDALDNKYQSDTSELNSQVLILKKGDKEVHIPFTVAVGYDHPDRMTIHYGRALEPGDYTLTVKEMRNAYLKPMTSESTLAFTATDSKAPEFPTSVMAKREDNNARTYYFIFNEPMALTGPYSIMDLSKYTGKIFSNDGSIYVTDYEKYADGITMEVINEGYGVAMHINETAANKIGEDYQRWSYNKYIYKSGFEIARVADAKGNVTSDLSSGLITGYTSVGAVAIDIEKVEITADNQAKVYFSDSFSEFNAKDITFTYQGVELKASTVDVETVDRKDVATYTFAKERRPVFAKLALLASGPSVFYGFEADENGEKLKVDVTGHEVTENGVTKKVITSHNELGNYLAKGDTSVQNLVSPALIYDKTAPSVEMIDNDNDESTPMVARAEISSPTTARIKFTEDIHPGSVSYSSFEALGHTVTAIEVHGDYLTITIDGFKRDEDGDIIKDASGNDLTDHFEVGDTLIQTAPISDMNLNDVDDIEVELYKTSDQ